MEDQKINFTFTVKQTNLILSALSEKKFSEVHEIISLIQVEGQRQIAQANAQPIQEAPLDDKTAETKTQEDQNKSID